MPIPKAVSMIALAMPAIDSVTSFAVWWETIVPDVVIGPREFYAGGCGTGRYRNQQYENWEEDIDVTWIKGEKVDFRIVTKNFT